MVSASQSPSIKEFLNAFIRFCNHLKMPPGTLKRRQSDTV